MPLFSRWALPEDLLLHRRLLLACYGPDESLHRQLPYVWKTLSDRSNLIATLVEKGSDPANRTPVHTLAGTFVDSDFAQILERTYDARIGALVASEVLAEGSGVLSLTKIREAQASDGLNFVVIHGHFFQPDSPAVPFVQAKEVASQTLFHSLRGYNLRSLYREVTHDQSVQWLKMGGMKIIPRRPSELTESASQENPILMRVTREDAEKEEGTRMSTLFVDFPAIFGLKANFRELLSVALRGSTDKQIAEELSLSVPAVKRRWERLYMHVEAINPELWRSWSGEVVESARGSERRRHLLNYFRDHPEEMRPWVD